MTRRVSVWLSLLLPCAIAGAGAGSAAPIVIGASDSGWYTDAGSHTASNQNYVVGYDGLDELRNFFVFDLTPLLGQTVLSVTLRVYNPMAGEPDVTFGPGYDSPDASETWELHEVTTPAVVVTAGGVGQIATYNDLGDGDAFGSYLASAADNGSFVEVALNAAGVAAVDAAIGNFVIGGLLTSYSGQTSAEEVVFGHTDPPGFGPYTRELVITVVPEPGTAALFGLGLAGLATRGRRKP